jgi:polyisoprenyl-phosphate glycosyltransferase
MVIAARREKSHSIIKKLYSKVFYSLLSWLTGAKYDRGLASFGIYHRNVIIALCKMRESIRCFPVMVQWIGFKKTTYEVQHDPRTQGKTSYNFSKLVNLAIDIMLAYSDKPLRLMIKLGVMIAMISFLFAGIYLYKYLNGQILVPGYASLIVSIWLLSGLIILILGVVGLYIGKTFEGVKERPLYIIKEIIND